jgi:hypothetical protein
LFLIGVGKDRREVLRHVIAIGVVALLSVEGLTTFVFGGGPEGHLAEFIDLCHYKVIRRWLTCWSTLLL